MKGRIGTKHYDTEKATLVEVLPDGIEVYRKKGRSTEFYLYNPKGTTAREKFCDLPAEQAVKYLPENKKERKFSGNTGFAFTDYDLERIKRYAFLNHMSANKFLLMLVDEYEKSMVK